MLTRIIPICITALLATAPFLTASSHSSLKFFQARNSRNSLSVESYVWKSNEKVSDCPIKIENIAWRCTISLRPIKHERVGKSQLFAWPTRGIDGPTCRRLVCISSDRDQVEITGSTKQFSMIKRLVLVRKDGFVLALAASNLSSHDTNWVVFIDDGQPEAHQHYVWRALSTFLETGAAS